MAQVSSITFRFPLLSDPPKDPAGVPKWLQTALVPALNRAFQQHPHLFPADLNGELRTRTYTIATQPTAPNAGVGAQVVVSDAGNKFQVSDGTTWMTFAGSSSISAATNIGTLGQGVYDSLNVTTLQFRDVAAGSSKVTVTLDGNHNILIDVVPANLFTTAGSFFATESGGQLLGLGAIPNNTLLERVGTNIVGIPQELIGSTDIGATSLITGQFMFQYQRLALSGTNRFIAPGTSQTYVGNFGAFGALYVGTPRGNVSFNVASNFNHNVQNTLLLSSYNRVTLEGTANVYVEDNFTSRSRVVLAGRG